MSPTLPIPWLPFTIHAAIVAYKEWRALRELQQLCLYHNWPSSVLQDHPLLSSIATKQCYHCNQDRIQEMSILGSSFAGYFTTGVHIMAELEEPAYKCSSISDVQLPPTGGWVCLWSSPNYLHVHCNHDFSSRALLEHHVFHEHVRTAQPEAYGNLRGETMALECHVGIWLARGTEGRGW